MKFSTYAEVLTPDHPLSKAYADGFKKGPGFLLQDVLRETGGKYEVTIELPLKVRDDVRRLAKMTADSDLARVADSALVRISLEQLRGLPGTTRIVYGCRLDREPNDGALPGLDP